MGKVHYLTRGTRDPRGVPTSTRSRSVSTIPLTCITSVIGYVSNKHPNCYIWQSRYFEEGSHVVLGTMYRKVKIVGSYEVGRNYIMMRLDEVGRVSEVQIAIQRMVFLTHPSPPLFSYPFISACSNSS